MWRAAPSAIETGQNSPVTSPQALTRDEYQSVVLLFPSCSMGERPTAREAKTENRVEIFLRGNAKGENEFRTSGRQPGSNGAVGFTGITSTYPSLGLNEQWLCTSPRQRLT